jgi:hypothetical protein
MPIGNLVEFCFMLQHHENTQREGVRMAECSWHDSYGVTCKQTTGLINRNFFS